MFESVIGVNDNEHFDYRRRGYSTARGLDGIEIFRKNNIQLVVLDLMLPDIEGEEVCRILRRISDDYIFGEYYEREGSDCHDCLYWDA